MNINCIITKYLTLCAIITFLHSHLIHQNPLLNGFGMLKAVLFYVE